MNVPFYMQDFELFPRFQPSVRIIFAFIWLKNKTDYIHKQHLSFFL